MPEVRRGLCEFKGDLGLLALSWSRLDDAAFLLFMRVSVLEHERLAGRDLCCHLEQRSMSIHDSR
jgi:hypothetical protein